jgi:hypothetical protein
MGGGVGRSIGGGVERRRGGGIERRKGVESCMGGGLVRHRLEGLKGAYQRESV